MLHQPGPTQDAVSHQLGRNNKVEWRQNLQEGDAGFQCQLGGVVQEEAHQAPAPGEIQYRQGQAQNPNQLQGGPEALLDSIQLLRPQVLGGIVGDTVAQGGEGGDNQVVQLHRSGVSGHHIRAEAIDNALD